MEITGFRTIEKISETNTTIVFTAEKLDTGDTVLIKSLKNDRATPDEYYNLKNDYTISQKISASSILIPLAFISEQGKSAIIYENFPGKSLQNLMPRASFSIEDSLIIAIKLSVALNDIHKSNIIHNNINPQSILYDNKSRTLKITDFRFSSAVNKTLFDADSVNKSSNLVYISPEQTGRINRSIDFRSDYYSLGIVLYELFTFIAPFVSSNPIEIIHYHIALEPHSPHELNPEVPEAVSNIIMKLIKKMVEDRYQSISGLVFDLEHCLENYKSTGDVKPFPLGREDFSLTLSIPEKLFGREREIKLISQLLEKVSQGGNSVLLVSGVAGSGKTALINEVTHLQPNNTLNFVRGKFEQFESENPYLAFSQAFNEFTKILLGQNENDLQQWKNKIIQGLGALAKLITDFVPSLEKVIGVQDDLPMLGPNESQNRFKLAISTFFQTIVSEDSSLVLVIDDLQWADSASLALFQELSSENIPNLFLIGIYRNNEIGDNHPVNQIRSKLKHQIKEYKEIELSDLSYQDIELMVSESLNMSISSVANLVNHIYKQTKGNAFYSKQYFQSLYTNKNLVANENSHQWSWELPDASSYHEPIDVITFLTAKLEKLSTNTYNLLKIAACMGNSFSIKDFLFFENFSIENTEELLQPAINLGILINSGLQYKFLHDRVQQAIIERLTPHEKSQNHLHIGWNLFHNLRFDEKYNRLFEIVAHLNAGYDRIESDLDKKHVLELNYEACLKALNSTAYRNAMIYITHCKKDISLLPTSEDVLKFKICLMEVRALYLNTEYEKAKIEILLLMQDYDKSENKSEIYTLLKDIILSQDKNYQEAVLTGINVLKSVGIQISSNQTDLENQSQKEINAIQQIMVTKTIDSLLDLPEMTDPLSKVRANILIDLWEAAYYCANQTLMNYCNLKLVSLFLKNGNSNQSAFGFVLFGLYYGLKNDYNKAYGFGNLALKLNEKYEDRVMLPKVTNLFCNYINFHKNSFKHSATLYEKSFNVGKENGDHLFGLWAALFITWSQLLSGQSLPSVYQKSLQLSSFIKQTNDKKIEKAFRTLQLMLLNLLGETPDHQTLSSETEHAVEYLEYWKNSGFVPGGTWYGIIDAQLKLINRDFAGGLKTLNENTTTLDPAIIMFPVSQYYFYHSLHSLGFLADSTNLVDEKLMKSIDENISLYENWSTHSPVNFEFYALLLKAERENILGNYWLAIELYEKANAAATRSESLFNLALINEYEGRFWIHANNNRLARYCLQSASNYYKQWGAIRKNNQLLKEFSSLDIPTSIDDHTTTTNNSVFYSNSSINTQNFDINAVLIAAKEISSEISMKKLLINCLKIIITNAGAERGVILLKRDDEILVEAQLSISNPKHKEKLSVTLDNYSYIPKSIIHYAIRSNESVLLENAVESKYFSNDEYIKTNKVKSILCEIVRQHKNLDTIIYLENNLTKSAFTESRQVVTKILLSQAAISIENVSLYENLQSEIRQHKVTGKALLESEFRMRLSQQYSNIGAWDWNIKTGDIFWTEQIAPLFGYEKGELETSYENFINAVHPDDRTNVQDAIEDCFQGNDFEVEHRVVWPNGEVRWMSETGGVIRDSEGLPARMLGIVQDITKNKNSELALVESEQRFRQLAENIKEVFWIGSPDWQRVYYVSPAYKEIFGKSESSLYKNPTSWVDAVHPDDREQVFKTIELKTARLDTGPDFPFYRIVQPDGKIRWLHARAYPRRK